MNTQRCQPLGTRQAASAPIFPRPGASNVGDLAGAPLAPAAFQITMAEWIPG